jgi:NitT/TauT family transport system ATP-binding protein
MSPHPGRLREIVKVDLPRPRSLDDVGTAEFGALKQGILKLILG